jgi:hypothetical protein
LREVDRAARPMGVCHGGEPRRGMGGEPGGGLARRGERLVVKLVVLELYLTRIGENSGVEQDVDDGQASGVSPPSTIPPGRLQ